MARYLLFHGLSRRKMDYFSLTLCEARKRLASGELTSVRLTESVLSRIDTVEDRVRSFITLDREGALVQAEKADRLRLEGKAGRLCGMPISVKDVLCTSNMQTTCGSRILENFVPPYDATVIEKLKEEGAVIVGKLAMDEFAMGSTSENCAYGVPENPWKQGYVAGGSSGGSAACVAADESLASLGSDTGVQNTPKSL